jgi:hypothetical protein
MTPPFENEVNRHEKGKFYKFYGCPSFFTYFPLDRAPNDSTAPQPSGERSST